MMSKVIYAYGGKMKIGYIEIVTKQTQGTKG